ncbi:MAG TPA: iron-containing redox enzyme family protein [Burkholderiales bacterium]|nr:iron-containing redox enzyme family protein [Burkholderiales bacterium]
MAARVLMYSGKAAKKEQVTDHAERLRRIGREHPLWNHELIKRCRSGRLTLTEVRTLGAQMYKFSREFSRYLAKALAVCPHEDARVVIAENLWEELGEGDPARCHPALFRRFTRAIGIDDERLELIPAEPETQRLVDTYLGFADKYGVLGALGAICYASEGIVATLYSQIERGLVRSISFKKDDLIFFDLHIHVDNGHANQLESVIAPLMTTPESFEVVTRAIREGLDARYAFFDGVLRAAAARKARAPRNWRAVG